MGLKSAYEDLRKRTLERVEGVWAKLSYVAATRGENGIYQHWGFERAHGADAAQRSFARAHHSLVGEVLRTRLRCLREDLDDSSVAAGVSPVSYASGLKASLARLLPSDSSKMTELHLLSVLKSLSLLATRQHSGPRSASPRRRPGR